jgi:hypothetical protein
MVLGADQKISMDLTGDDAKLLVAMRRVIDTQGRMRGAAKKVNEETRRGESAFKRFTGSVMGQVSGVVAGFASVQSAIALIGGEIENVRERWRGAAEAIKTTAPEFLGAVSALPEHIRKAVDLPSLIREARAAGFVSTGEILKGIAAVGSTIGAGTPEQFRDVLLAGARASRITAGEETGLFAGAALKVGEIAGLRDAQAALGLLFRLGTSVKVEELSTQATNIPTALAKIVGVPGEEFTGAARLYSVFGQYMQDPTGLTSGSAGAAIAQRVRTRPVVPTGTGILEPVPLEMRSRPTLEILEWVRERYQRRGVTQADIDASITAMARGVEGGAFVGAFMQRDPRLEASMRIARETFRDVTTPEAIRGLQETFTGRLTELEAMPEVQALMTQRAFAAGAEAIRLGDPESQLRGIISEGMRGMMQAGGTSAFRQRLQRVMELFDQGAPGAIGRAEETLLGMRGEYEARPAMTVGAAEWQAGYGGYGKVLEAREGQPRMLEAFDLVIEQLRVLADLTREGNSQRKQQADATTTAQAITQMPVEPAYRHGGHGGASW